MAETTKVRKASSKPDLASIAGIVVAFGGILGGLIIEGGKLKDVAQFTAAMIVLGGTAGAVMVSMPQSIIISAIRRVKGVFLDAGQDPNFIIDELINYAAKARKNGLVSLELEAEHIQDPFLKKAITLAVDGTDLTELRKMLELEIGIEEEHAEAEAKVFECAGGYAPTVGIIGAVMGLIQVMKNLANIDEVGHGIAVAFVATVYGVGISNLILLPAANKMKARGQVETKRKEMILEGVTGIVEGLNPKLIRSKLEAYARGAAAPKGDKKSAKTAASAVGAEA